MYNSGISLRRLNISPDLFLFIYPKQNCTSLVVRCPSTAHANGLFPLCPLLVSSQAVNLWLENRSALAIYLPEVLELFPDTGSQAGSDGGTEGGGLAHGGAVDGDAADVGLRLHAEVRVGQAAVNGERFQGLPRVGGHGVEDGCCLVAGCLESGAGDVALLCVRGDAD